MDLFSIIKRQETRWRFEERVQRHGNIVLVVAAAFFPNDEFHCGEVQHYTLMRLWKNNEQLPAMDDEARRWMFTNV
jgi:hypothetical protein